MGDETHVETIIEAPEEHAEAAATEALARVAETAIEETAERVAALTAAITSIESLRSEFAALREEFNAHVASNTADFERVAEGMGTLGVSVAALEAALIEEAEAIEEEMREELREEMEEAAGHVDATTEGVASVEAAEAIEPERFTVPETPAAETPAPAHHGRRMIDRLF